MWISANTGHIVPVVLRGKIDTGLSFEDGTNGICDFKTGEPRGEHVTWYGRQLHAYAICTEHLAPNALKMEKVSRLGLLVFEPNDFTQLGSSGAALLADLHGSLTWLDIRRNNIGFFAFLRQVASVAANPASPPPSANCKFCAYRLSGGLLNM